MADAFPEELFSYGIPLRGPPEPWNFRDYWTAWGVAQTKIVSSNNRETYNLGVCWIFVTLFHLTQAFKNETRALQDSQTHLVTYVDYNFQGELPMSFRVNSFLEKHFCSHTNMPAGWSEREVIPESSSSTDTHHPFSWHWYHTLGNIHHIFHQAIHGWAR